ncbi:LytR family transcriptional regulator [Streptomyces sp. RKND-216]|uniref:LCP family protein n=1 Tax=Streptomyces sp. RKND-216 TaxID=2562581 RepID=UPI00109DE65F|nr:LCP family protein [Streptomyces sp. RKND-216]THA25511.1 LytR family transcriptional regulator [Streptomyces sp. RKND-216]
MTHTESTVEERADVPAARPGRDGSGGGGSADGGAEMPSGPKRRRGRRVLLWCLAGVLLLVGGPAGYGWWRADSAADSIPRIPDALPNVPERQQPPPGAGVTFLLVGLDTRSGVPTTGDDAQAPAWRAGASRSDTMMLFHLSADREDAAVVSLARDTWVEIPGHGEAKLNAAYSWGGPALAVRTVQDVTGVRVDHLAVVDWNGFRELTDAVGGVDITVPRDIPGRGDAPAHRAGTHRMNGEEALAYVRERKGLPRGDLDRTARQQNFLRALMGRVLSGETLSSPSRVSGLLDSVGDVVGVDDGLSNSGLYDLAWGMRGLRTSDVRFLNAPVDGFGTRQGQSVVLLDRERAAPLWEAIREDRVTEYLATHDTDGLKDPGSVR